MSKVIVKGALVRASFCKLFLSLFLAVLGLPCSTWSLFSCIEWRLVAAYELLIAVASVVTEHQLRVQASVGTVHGLTCPKACGILPDQGSNPYPLHWQVDS